MQNCFEMYGADFMISDDFRTWLIEMNASPCMAPSTPITAHLVAEVTDDLMKGTPYWRTRTPATSTRTYLFTVCYVYSFCTFCNLLYTYMIF